MHRDAVPQFILMQYVFGYQMKRGLVKPERGLFLPGCRLRLGLVQALLGFREAAKGVELGKDRDLLLFIAEHC